MKKVFSTTINADNNKCIEFTIFLQKNCKYTKKIIYANNRTEIEKNLILERISFVGYNTEVLHKEILNNLDCKVYNIQFTTSKNVRCGFGGYRIATKKHSISNVSDFELIHYKDKDDFKIMESLR